MDSLEPRKKERSFKEIMGDMAYSPDGEGESDVKDLSKSVSSSSGKKRKMPDSLADGSDPGAIHAAKVYTTISPAPKPSFKIGECIRRVASQLNAPTLSSSKGNIDQTGIDGGPQINEHHEEGSTVVPVERSSLEEMLSQLKPAAQDPKNGHSHLRSNVTFFTGFRSSIALNRRGRKKKASVAADGTGEFEFDDANDSYWTDRIVQNYSGEQLLQARENGEGQYPPVQSGRRLHSRKRYSCGNHVNASEESNEYVNNRKQESFPAELVLNFAERDSLPSEINLTRIFKRFGPLMNQRLKLIVILAVLKLSSKGVLMQKLLMVSPESSTFSVLFSLITSLFTYRQPLYSLFPLHDIKARRMQLDVITRESVENMGNTFLKMKLQ